jgi:two-component system, OmpR family, sensor histidine kinase TctE
MAYISIKKQLIGWLSYSFILISILSVLSIYLLINDQINKYFDNALMHESSNIIDRLYVHNAQIKFKNPYSGINLQTSAGDSSVFYSIQDASYNFIAGFKNIPKPKDTKTKQTFYDTKFLGQPLRVFRKIYTMTRSNHTYTVFITVAETLEDRKKVIYKIFSLLFIITVSISINTLIFTLISINKGLQPLKDLQHSIRNRDIHDLTPIKENKTPIEVISLVQSINHLFKELKRSFLHVEQFNEDVSHQLRTPLAELKILLQTDESINKEQKALYLESINTMTYTTEQLLLRAHTNPDTYDRTTFSPFDLTKLCKKVAQRKAPILFENNFDIVFEAKSSMWMNGSPIVIESLLNNLIDNAQKYAKNKSINEKNIITLRLKEEPTTLVMFFSDNGPGIAEKFLDQVCDRFFRLDMSQKGTGLGLNIIKQIVKLHNGSIKISNKKPHGLEICIIFPKYKET